MIGDLTVTDPEQTTGFTYTLSDDRFEVVNGQLKLEDGVALDYEQETQVSIDITVTDADSNDYTETFVIDVTDIDDPTDLALSNSSVEENDAGAVIGDLTVTDPDQTTGFTYTLSDDRFEVVSGQLKLKDGVALDYEQETQVSIDITVTDVDSNDYTETFNIVVNDVDEAPTDLALSNSSVEENDAGAVIGDLTVTDPEQTTGFTYTLSDDRFEVVSGQLKLKDGVALDYEQETQVSIDITVTDVDSNDYTETFVIDVTDIDDPTDLALSNSSVEENDAGAVIGDLTVTDPDQTTGFTYTLSDDRFEVVSGQLKLKDGVALDYEQETQVSIDITVTDVDSNAYTETFVIDVTDIDDPTDLALSNSSVEENAAGAVIGDLTVTDPDQTTGFTYTLSDDRFEVVSGQLKLKDGVALDYEQETQVSIDITVTDVDSNAYTETFVIDVTDIDDPTDLALSNSSVEENAAGAVIGDLTVTDPDQTTGFTYTLSDDRFEVVSGQLKLKDGVALDYEQETQVSIDITVTDVDSNDYTETFVIDVTDIDDPTDLALSNSSVEENDAGAVIGDLTVTDPDQTTGLHLHAFRRPVRGGERSAEAEGRVALDWRSIDYGDGCRQQRLHDRSILSSTMWTRRRRIWLRAIPRLRKTMPTVTAI